MADSQLIGSGRCKTLDPAQDFAWADDNIVAAATLPEFKTLAFKCSDTEPFSRQTEKLLNARQNAAKEVRSFTNRMQMLGTASVAGTTGKDSKKAQMSHERCCPDS